MKFTFNLFPDNNIKFFSENNKFTFSNYANIQNKNYGMSCQRTRSKFCSISFGDSKETYFRKKTKR